MFPIVHLMFAVIVAAVLLFRRPAAGAALQRWNTVVSIVAILPLVGAAVIWGLIVVLLDEEPPGAIRADSRYVAPTTIAIITILAASVALIIAGLGIRMLRGGERSADLIVLTGWCILSSVLLVPSNLSLLLPLVGLLAVVTIPRFTSSPHHE